ncbi:hypothetical protein [Demequina maris]|uniref:hypothetical protein n=1 Tax=Demequina maris TaxID=1638982 RepID=UPI00078648D6|nr:hypothetical protein [Demequina maris]
MSRQLRDMLGDVAGGHQAAFDDAHRGDDTSLYVRAIAPRRRVRRAAPLVTAAAVALILVVGVLGFGPQRSTVEPAHTAPTPSASDEASAPERTTTGQQPLPGQPGWAVDGLVLQPDAVAAAAAASLDGALADSPDCALLDSIGRLENASAEGWVEATHVGAFMEATGATNDVRVAQFDSADSADAYVDLAAATARGCGRDLQATSLDVEVSRVGLTGVPGAALRVIVTDGELAADDGRWMLWLHVDGTDALAVVVEPGATDRAVAIIGDWVRGAGA